jgi:hypothetical protein
MDSCIGPCITTPDPFVILRCWKRDDGVSVGECKDGDLWFNEQLLDDSRVGGRRSSKRHAMGG